MLSADEPHVRVTLDQIYGICLEVKQTVTEVLTENRARDRQVDRHEQQIASLDARVDQVEQHRATRAELQQMRDHQADYSMRLKVAIVVAVLALMTTVVGGLVLYGLTGNL